MEDRFELPVVFKEQQLLFPTFLKVTGYTHKFVIEIEGQDIFFEPDEERNYRAVVPYEEIGKNKSINPELLKSIALAIEELVK